MISCKVRENEKVVNNFTKEEIEWLKALSQDKNYNREEFLNNYYCSSQTTLSIFRYRNYLISKQNNIKNLDSVKCIMEKINNKDCVLIKKEFENMFLEPFDDEDVKIIMHIIKNKEILMKVIQIHNNKKTDRLMSILTRI